LGVRGMLNLKRPWWLALVLFCLGLGILGGFRSFLVGVGLLLLILFFLEGLHRTRFLALLLGLGIVGVGMLVLFSEHLPGTAQRALSFLPIKVDPSVKQDAQGSLEWRLQMWDLLKRQIPEHLVVGKGYAIDPALLQLSEYNARKGFGIQAEWAMLSGDYHNGPLSVLIPMGIPGVLAFVWFLIAAARRLRGFCRDGDPALLTINRALFAMFLARIIFFLFFFGSFFSELVEFTVLIGLAESLNKDRAVVRETDAEDLELSASGQSSEVNRL